MTMEQTKITTCTLYTVSMYNSHIDDWALGIDIGLLEILPLPTKHTPKHTVHRSVRGCGQLQLIKGNNGNPFAEQARDLPVELLLIED